MATEGQIRRMSADDRYAICSAQVITDVPTAVKELVENALVRVPGRAPPSV
jgi:DNA mismatch repair ATPase MutL